MIENEDKILIKASKNDTKSIELLFNEYNKKGLDIAYRIVNRSDVAEDMIMEAFLKIVEKKFKIKENFSAYFYRAIINNSFNYLKKSKRENVCPNEFNYDIVSEDNPEKEIEKRETIKKIKNAINELTDNQKTAFILIYYEQFTYKEVANIMKISVKAVESHISRAKSSLKEKLKEL